MSTAAKDIGSVRTWEHWINGQSTPSDSGQHIDDLNPDDDSVYARLAAGTATDIDKAVQTAQQAFESYSKLLASEREAILSRTAGLVEQHRQEFVDILVDEVGSPVGKAQFEVAYGIGCLRAAAGVARQVRGETIPPDTPGRLSMSIRQPLGVIASITPFNVPFLKHTKLSSTPLATGNTVVMLASEFASVTALRLAELYQEAGLPEGAFNVVTGMGADIGDSLTAHPLTRVVMFTGSSRVGQHIVELCAPAKKRVILELGGKNPLIVLKDADIDAAAQAAAFGTFFFQGQACMASSRIYVERPVLDEFVAKFKGIGESLGMGDLRDPDTWLGPIISDRQRNRVRTHIEDARDKGATVVTGGEWIGNRCKPTILTGVEEGMTVCREETFGPVTSVYPVDSADEALEKANDTEFGLSAAVFTRDIDTALTLAQDIKSGMVHINAPTIADEPHVPFGGVGESGYGREGTDIDIDTLTEWKWITIQLPTG
ncbi:MAG: aldehyde dehydrogenase family protein [Gammaproteobacteria bacterium]|nr:aldehyde dehydrogenase family protein [Gammaproteobacteria bacterium]